MKMLSKFSLLITLSLLLFSCENEEIIDDYIQRDANASHLIGTWAIQTVTINGNTSEAPISFQECGTDYFTYSADNVYQETVFKTSLCNADKANANWALKDGIINLSSNTGESQTIEVRKLNENIFIFQVYLDLDVNNGTEAYIFTATRYTPPKEVDIYTDTFYQKSNDSQIEFTWNKYSGYKTFLKYEIYRTDETCNSSSVKLIKTITDVNENYFVDLEAFSTEHCYQLKIYTDEGLLGESNLITIFTDNLRPEHVNFVNANVNNESVTLTWEKSEDPYFSHYEIKYYDTLDFTPNYNEHVTVIDDVNITSFTDTNPPYLLQPVYVILVYNKFGNYSYIIENENSISVNLNRIGMLDIEYLYKMVYDRESKSFIFYYRESTYGNYKFAKYSTIDKKFVAESYKQPTSSTSTSMQIIDSETGYGKEFIYPQNDELWVYNADDLTYKYAFNLSNSSTGSFSYLGNDIWVVTDNENVFTYLRNNDAFTLLDKKPHFTQHQGSGHYEILKIDTNTILVSHDNEGRAILYKIDENGIIVNHGIKNIPLQYNYNHNNVQYNSNSTYIVNTTNNKIYSANDYSLIKEYNSPAITSNLSRDGSKIYGTNNTRELTDDYNTAKKEVIIYDIATRNIETKESKGYPLYITDNEDGNIICLSANFPGETFDNFESKVKNLFIEVIE
ncbi:fibronectin type III domain-containing protein [uncultured Polaribacter sp.]|uniref:lipocalin family protein n=1 Tax=uncultured Polaribacter sp. TaxID=174711 RepID=UPI00261B6130|nr:fibronectin type III domain-containing protein [uncultured Polaribacter sp.]